MAAKKYSYRWWLARRPSLRARLAESLNPSFVAPIEWHRAAARILANRRTRVLS